MTPVDFINDENTMCELFAAICKDQGASKIKLEMLLP